MENWLVSYRKEWLRPDVIAGLTTAAVVIPNAMAYATIAGLPVQVGLYTAFLPMVIYAVLGNSRVLSVSTTTPQQPFFFPPRCSSLRLGRLRTATGTSTAHAAVAASVARHDGTTDRTAWSVPHVNQIL